MGGDWNKPRDKGPEIEEGIPKKKRKKGKKKYTIEYKYKEGYSNHFIDTFFPHRKTDWSIWGRYEKERDRDNALSNLMKKQNADAPFYCRLEFRIND